MKVFRKTVMMAMVLILCGMVMAGCKKGGTNTPENVTDDTPADDTSDVDQKDNSSNTPEEITGEGTVEEDGNVISKQLAFVYNENTIAISDIVDDKKIESILGKPDKVKTHTYSEDDGLNMDNLNGMTEKQYLFPGLVIKTINGAKDKEFFIYNIEITDQKYPVIRNIKVGDSFEELKEAYPEGTLMGGELSDEEDDYRYEPVDYVDAMIFHIKDKKVESIQMFTLLD